MVIFYNCSVYLFTEVRVQVQSSLLGKNIIYNVHRLIRAAFSTIQKYIKYIPKHNNLWKRYLRVEEHDKQFLLIVLSIFYTVT